MTIFPTPPEVYWTRPSKHAPNSHLPILIYRGVLLNAPSGEEKRKSVEANDWLTGGVWGPISRPHYHSNTHECYVPIAAFELRTGDVAVHAAGVEHCNIESSEDYRYLALYPKGAPRWDSVYTELSADEKRIKAGNARHCSVAVHDPVYGRDGPLPMLWRQADAKAGVHA